MNVRNIKISIWLLNQSENGPKNWWIHLVFELKATHIYYSGSTTHSSLLLWIRHKHVWLKRVVKMLFPYVYSNNSITIVHHIEQIIGR